ncbi:NAD(P)-dependent alcohol dehydrogenase [Euzebya tangerina]|uniref:NAD(P)-dependent alcohol dehydrogenase n=1 Tax=Euzebya tangerina TaxID=591198 RepID=UPI000E3236D6|nr:NAD(P)-dependent alcohol dehydrogenase [Euzebya tangerina]
MRALQLPDWKSDPKLVEVDQPEPGPGEVVVKIGGSGACHSDLHLMHDFEGEELPWSPPFTLGHENAGWVDTVGDGVSAVEVGQAVAVYGPWGCGRCPRCRVGVENYCENPEAAPIPGGGGGLGLDGGMAEFMLVPHERLLVPLPDGLEPAVAAPLSDAGLTPYHAIRRSLPRLLPNTHTVAIGLGGLGHVGVQMLSAMSATTIIAVDLKEEALAGAEADGAHVTILSDDGAAEEIMTATGGKGADLVLDFVGADPTIGLAMSVVRPMGEVTVVGIGGGTFEWAFMGVPYESSLANTYWGTRPELIEVLNLGARGLIRPRTTTFSLDDAVGAYEQLDAGDLDGRAVIVP